MKNTELSKIIWTKLSPLRKQGPSRVFALTYLSQHKTPTGSLLAQGRHSEKGNVLLYVLMAIGLMAALTYAYVKDSRENYASQSAVQIAETLFAQANMIRSAVVQCSAEYPSGGGDLNADGTITPADNPNNPFPINPSSALHAGRTIDGVVGGTPDPIPAAVDDTAKYLSCIGAPASVALMFSGANNQGRFLPPTPSGFSEWTYTNDTSGVPAPNGAGNYPNGKGVYIRITGPANDAASINALNRVMNKFTQYQADLNYGGCGATCLTIWIQRNCTTTCP